MADVKISALPAATTPLAGTEVLPIVQSGVTTKVAVSDLTAGRSVSATAVAITGSTSGTATIVTPAVAGTPTITLPIVTGTLATLAGAETLTNKTLTGAVMNGTVGATTPAAGAFTTLSATGITTVAAGSAALPAIVSTTGTADTGLWFPAADTVAASTAGAERMRINSSGNVGIGTTSISNKLEVNGTINIANGSSVGWGNQQTTITGSTATNVMQFYTAAVERMRIDSSGIVTMPAYGAGAATFSASGVISSVSDETWKVKDGAPVDKDAMLNKLEPGYWYYNDDKKETFGKDRQLGFYAQNVNAAIGPEAAPEPETVTTKNEDGTETSSTKPWGYYDRSVLAVTVMSLQKALATIESLTARITALEAKA